MHYSLFIIYQVANGGSSSARQTLQFEDVDTSRYTSEPVYLPLDTNSPHRYTSEPVYLPLDTNSSHRYTSEPVYLP